MIKQLLTDATVRSKTTLWTFFTGFFGIAVDEMMHQSQCSTCEAWSLKSWDKGSAGEKLLFFESCDADFWMQQTRDYTIILVGIPKQNTKQKTTYYSHEYISNLNDLHGLPWDQKEFTNFSVGHWVEVWNRRM